MVNDLTIKPNFFLVGAPKCGTTALSEYLKTHPNVYFSPVKEPDYFASDFRAGSTGYNGASVTIDSLKEYLDLFKQATKEHKVIGEASATYLSSEVALQNIYKFNPDAKIIVMLRHPVDLVYAYYSQIVFNLGENISDFEKAWQLQSSRKRGENIPPLCGNVNVLQYRKIGQIGSQVEQLLTIFPSKQVKVILFDDFKNDTAKVYNDVLSFLDLPPQNKQSFPIINSNKAYKSALIAHLTQKPPKVVVNVIEGVKSYLQIDSLGIGNYIHKRNNSSQKREPLKPEFRKQLVEEFIPEVNKLEKNLNLNLEHWKQ